jgi:hypothetical protein
MLSLFALLLAFADAAFIDVGPPQDVLGNWKFDLYDQTNAQRGTNTNPIVTDIPADTSSAAVNITAQDVSSTSTVQFGGQVTIAGTPTTSSTAVMPISAVQTVMVVISGTWTGTLAVEVSSDNGVTYQPRAMHVLGTALFSNNLTSNAVGSINGTAKTHVRVRATTAMTGTAVVKFVSSNNLSNVYVGNAVKIIDGTATTSPPSMTIKAASTPVVATDPAVVVTVSPNASTIIEEKPWTSKVLIGNGTTVIKTGSGILHGFVINNNATGGVIYLYDNTAGSGTITATGNAGTPSGGLLSGSGNPGANFVGPLEIAFTNGLTAVTQGSTTNSFTVIYR